MQIREPGAGPRQSTRGIIVQRAPCGLVTRMAGQLGAPEKRYAVPRLLLRSARMPVRRDNVAIELLRRHPVARAQLEQREMPAEMTVKTRIARVGSEP